MSILRPATYASRQLFYELVSGGSGLLLALFMWGHMFLVGSILTGRRGFDWVAVFLEDYYLAQQIVPVTPCSPAARYRRSSRSAAS